MSDAAVTTAEVRDERVRIDEYPVGAAEGLANDVRRGLLSDPKILLPKYFYDAAGSRLFDEITELPEYYPTRTELAILRERMPGIVERHAPAELVELGSGSSRKTVAILDAMADAGVLRHYAPFDVSASHLVDAAERIADAYPDINIHGVAGDFDRHLGMIPHSPHGVRLVAFLGGTVGNLGPGERRPFLRTLRSLLMPGDRLLVGTDLVKDVPTVEAAYNDAAGVTAAFNLNVLQVINRELGGDFDLDRFEHRAFYDIDNSWIEMRLRSRVDQVVHVSDLGLRVPFAAGEEMRTEISCKFTRSSLARMYETAGLSLVEFHTDPDGLFAVSIAARDDDPSILNGVYPD